MNTTEEVATKLVDYCRKGEWMKAVDDLYGKDIVSVEPRAMENMPAEMRRTRSSAWKNRLVGEKFRSAQLENRRAVCSRGHFRRAVRCGRDRESFEETNADVRGGNL